jgi:signal transduction histidine kinase
VYVAGSLDQVNAASSTLLVISSVAFPLAILIVALIMSRAVMLALRPVDRITRQAAAIDASGLHQRVPVPPTNDEIARLAATMNQMLTRLEDAAIRQRQFIGDASHELRSPLTGLRLQIDVALAHPDRARSQQVLETVSGEVTRLIDLTEDLLYLAKGTEGQQSPPTRTIDLDEILRAEIRRLRTANDPTVTVAHLEHVRVLGSEQDLARAIRNLTDNAREHASSEVTVSLQNIAGTATITITDDGPGVPPEQRDRIFQRFTQLDPARNRHAQTHFGLGLAIARHTVNAHGGRLTVQDRADQRPGASFLIRIPTTPVVRPATTAPPAKPRSR